MLNFKSLIVFMTVFFILCRYAIQKLSPFIVTQQTFEELLKVIYKSHCKWLPLHRDRYIERTSKRAIVGTVLEVSI